MRVRANGDLNAKVFRSATDMVIYIEPLRIGVQLDKATALLRRAQDLLEVDRVGGALAKKTPRRLGKDVEMLIIHGADHTERILSLS